MGALAPAAVLLLPPMLHLVNFSDISDSIGERVHVSLVRFASTELPGTLGHVRTMDDRSLGSVTGRSYLQPALAANGWGARGL